MARSSVGSTENARLDGPNSNLKSNNRIEDMEEAGMQEDSLRMYLILLPLTGATPLSNQQGKLGNHQWSN